MRRDERIMRFLTVKLDKYGVKYNDDKRNGKIGTKKSSSASSDKEEKQVVKDDLTLIEGIGPRIGNLLKTSGVTSYAKLATLPTDEIKSILSKGGSNYTSHDPTSWPEQAQLAADGKWSALNALKEKLVGGVNPSSEEE